MRFICRATLAALSLALLTACGGGVVTPTLVVPASVPGVPTLVPVPSIAVPSIPALPSVPASPVPTSGTPGTAICDLLTPADLNAATGKEYAAGTIDPFGECFWNLAGVTSNTGSLIVGVIQPQQLSFIKAAFGSGGVDTTVAGHAAFWNPGQGLNSLWVDIGNGQLFVLSFPSSGDLDPSYRALAENLAATAISRM